MRVHIYEQLMAMQASRRQLMKGAASAAAALAASSPLSLATRPAYAQDSVVAQIMKIPGAGNGSPTDADWQKVGELCLGPTKANVQPGEFKGVDFAFMGLNNQNVHNFLFRGFRSNGSISRRPITTPACSSRSPPAPPTSTSSRWARRSKGTWA